MVKQLFVCFLLPTAGSIMAVTMADKHAPGKESRFVGICIHRGGNGLRANFTLRNVIDGQGKTYTNISGRTFIALGWGKEARGGGVAL